MIKNSVIKAIVITFLIYVLASWIIPGGSFQNGIFTKGDTTPVGISDLFIYPISTSITSIFVLTAIIILLIGGLYGVMNKTGVYQNIVEGTAKKFKGSEKRFLVISILVFAILASLTTLTLPLLILVPFFVAVILTLGFNKMTALLSTIGAILVGNMGAMFGYNVDGYNFINYFFGLKSTENIGLKVLLFVLLTGVLVFYVLKTSDSTKTTSSSVELEKSTKSRLITSVLAICLGTFGAHRFYTGKTKTGLLYLFTIGLFGIGYIIDVVYTLCGIFTDSDNKLVYFWTTEEMKKYKKTAKKTAKKSPKKEANEEIVIPLYTKEKASKKSATPLVVVAIITVVIALVAMFNWAGALGTEKTIFDTWYTNITNAKINGYPLFANLLGSVKALGYWTNYELAMLLMVAILVIGFMYNLKFKDTYEAAVEGMKEMLPVAVVAVLANILLLVVNSAASSFIPTIYNSLFKMTKEFNFMTMSLAAMVGSVGYSQFPYLINSLYDPENALYAKSLSEVAFTLQAMHGFTMMLVPTSVGLVVGLKYLGISYKEWLKDNWRLLLSLFATALIVIIIVTLV